MDIDSKLHYTLDDTEIIKRLGAKPDAYKANKDAGNCGGCGTDMFFDTHGNVLMVADRSVLHVCDDCMPKLSRTAPITPVAPVPEPSKKKKDQEGD